VRLSRTYTLHTWYYYTHDFTWVDNFPRKARVNTNLCVQFFDSEISPQRGENILNSRMYFTTKQDSTWIYDFSRKVGYNLK